MKHRWKNELEDGGYRIEYDLIYTTRRTLVFVEIEWYSCGCCERQLRTRTYWRKGVVVHTRHFADTITMERELLVMMDDGTVHINIEVRVCSNTDILFCFAIRLRDVGRRTSKGCGWWLLLSANVVLLS